MTAPNSQSGYWPERQPAVRINWDDLIPDCPFDWEGELIPLDGQKRPIDPETGALMTGWSKTPGYDIEGLNALNGVVKAVGLRLGPPSGGMLAVDFDGPAAVDKFRDVFNREPLDLPPTVGVTSGKEMRGQRLFIVDQDWWPHLKGRCFWTNENCETCLELRWVGHQSVIAGAHPETAGYSWMTDSSTAERDVAPAPDWLLEPLVQLEEKLHHIEPSADDAARAVEMLKFIDPLSHSDYSQWLRVGLALHHTDPGLISDWVEWSRPMPTFNEAECLRKWPSFDNRKGPTLTIGTLHHLAKQGGYVEPKAKPQAEPATDQSRKADLKALAADAERIYLDAEIPAQERLVHLRHVARDLDITLRDTELQRYIWDVRRKQAGAIEGYCADDVIETPDQQWLLDDLLLAGDANLVVGLPKANKTTFVLSALGAIYNGDRQFLGKELADDLPPIFIAGTDQPGHIWQQFLQRSGLADAAGRRSPHIIKMFTRERPIHLTPEGIDVMVQAAEEHPGLIFLLDSYSTLTRPLQLEENSPAFADPFIDFCEAVAPYGATPIFIHHAGKGGQGKSATFSSRGTTALPAAASQLVDVARLNADDDRDKRRIIKTEGRLAEPIKILATFNGDAGWTNHGDAEQIELAQRLDEAEDKLNDRQFAALELMRDRWAQGFEISQADLDELKEFKAVDRNNRRRILDQLVRRELATSREMSTEKGRLKLFKPVKAEMSHSETPSGVSVRPDSSALPDSSTGNKGMSHINQLSHLSGTPQVPVSTDSSPHIALSSNQPDWCLDHDEEV